MISLSLSLFPSIFSSFSSTYVHTISLFLPLSLCSFPNTRQSHPPPSSPLTALRSFHAILLFPSLSIPSLSLFSLRFTPPIVVPHCPRSLPCPLPSRTRRSLCERFPPPSPSLSPCPFRSFAHLLHNRARGCQPARRVILYKYVSQINIRATAICMRAEPAVARHIVAVVVVDWSPSFPPWYSSVRDRADKEDKSVFDNEMRASDCWCRCLRCNLFRK